jgi:hypothetical protein
VRKFDLYHVGINLPDEFYKRVDTESEAFYWFIDMPSFRKYKEVEDTDALPKSEK